LLGGCPATAISYGQTIFANIGDSVCVENSIYFDEYVFNGTAGDQIDIRQWSITFVDKVELFDSSGTLLATDVIEGIDEYLGGAAN